eukprot:scaffold7504_cov97-Cylindrotheca_fusiformis.AAC.9
MTANRKQILLLLSAVWLEVGTAFVKNPVSLNCRPSASTHPAPHFARKGSFEENEESRESKKVRVSRIKQPNDSFVVGEELHNLRLDLDSLRQNLQWAEALKDKTRTESLAKAIKEGESRDPDYMYRKALGMIDQAKKMEDVSQGEKESLIEKWGKIAASARRYGEHGTQLVNITYVGDTLVATKVTGDRNVPRGEITFTVNLQQSSALASFQFSSNDQSGNADGRQFPGRGQVSRKDFKDHRFVAGQMLLIEEGFSFLWVPTKHQVVFSRPSPQTTLRLLRDTLSKEDEIENMREHIACCFDMDMTTCLARQQDPSNFEPLRRITLQKDLDKAEEHMRKDPKERKFLWQLYKWKKYIDQSLDKP